MDVTLIKELVSSGFSTRKIAKRLNVSQSTVRYWLVKLDLKTVVKHNCKHCGTAKPEDFTKGRYTECIRCRVDKQVARYRNYKIKAVEYKGGKCEICGYNKCFASLDFHHKDPTQKDPNWKKVRSWSFEKIKLELDKCMLVCRNCHGEIHYGL